MNDRKERRISQKPPGYSREMRGPAYARALRTELSQSLSDVREIASELGLSILEKDAEGFDGALVRATEYPMGAIVVRASIREAGRKNFTVAHEIGHFVLPGHHRASLACTCSDVANWADVSSEHMLEREADEFAAELLMPAALLFDVIGSSTPSLEVMEQIARKAQASLSASAWRYCDLTREKCAVAWSTDGVIQWAKRSAGFPFFLPGGWRVKEGTFAAACFAEEKVPGRPRVVPMQLWADAANLHSSFRLLEQSKALPSYRSVISLLWVQEDGVPNEEERPNRSGIRPLE
jgi:Zn-dependent peptidase ImmA (M78 family)